jgi:hypothetical protein
VTHGRLDERGAAIATTLPAGSVSYVDRDWLTATESAIPSLSFAQDGEVSWCGRGLGRLAAGRDPTAVAAGAFLGVAREAGAVGARARGTVEVVGNGLIGAYVRRLVALHDRSDGDRPSVVVDTTGNPDLIRAALERVSDLGTVVLAGEAAGRTLDLDLYSSVHKRGLVLAGVAPPLHGVDVEALPDVDHEDLEFCRDVLAEAVSDAPVSGDALWYRIVS